MKKINKNSVTGFVAGVAATVLLVGSGLPAAALSTLQEIKVSMGGISIYVDGQLKVPTDVNGNKVEPMIYNGTTYLPVRALTGMLTDKAVNWDQKTESVYIGKTPDAGQAVRMDTLKATKGYNFRTGESAQFKLLEQVQTPFNKLHGTYGTFLLDEGYATLQGMFVVPYTSLGSTNAGSLKVYSVDRYGVETLIDSYELRAADDAIPVSVNVRGCYAIHIRTDESVKIEDFSGSNGCFYDATITKAS